MHHEDQACGLVWRLHEAKASVVFFYENGISQQLAGCREAQQQEESEQGGG